MTQSRPVNDSALYRFVVLSAIRLLKHVRPHCGSVLFVSRGICIKYGHLINLSEASTMCIVSQHTSIPVPKIICAVTHRDKTYIVMERISGKMMGTTWLKQSMESRAKIRVDGTTGAALLNSTQTVRHREAIYNDTWKARARPDVCGRAYFLSQQRHRIDSSRQVTPPSPWPGSSKNQAQAPLSCLKYEQQWRGQEKGTLGLSTPIVVMRILSKGHTPPRRLARQATDHL